MTPPPGVLKTCCMRSWVVDSSRGLRGVVGDMWAGSGEVEGPGVPVSEIE